MLGVSRLLFLSVFSNSAMLLRWYASTRLVMASTSGSCRYGFASWASNGSTSLSMSIVAKTRYLRHWIRRKLPASS